MVKAKRGRPKGSKNRNSILQAKAPGRGRRGKIKQDHINVALVSLNKIAGYMGDVVTLLRRLSAPPPVEPDTIPLHQARAGAQAAPPDTDTVPEAPPSDSP